VPGLAVPLLAFHADFHIDSPVGQVDGTKDLVVTSMSNGLCQTAIDREIDPEFCLGVAPCVAKADQVSFFVINAAYQATITTASGTFRDSGTTNVGGARTYITLPLGGTSNNEGFTEQFTTSNGVEPLDAFVVTLSPPTAINTVGATHTVTATALNVAAGPVAGATIVFTVSGSVSTQGSCTTNAQGQCSFTYVGPQLPGADLITGCADNNHSGTADPGEPCGEATKIWMLPATQPGQVTGGGWIIAASGSRVSFGFNAQSDAQAAKGNCNLIDHGTKTHIKCLSVETLVVIGTHATFFGQASVDGTTTNYRIDVDDLGEPGSQDTFKIQTDNGYTAGGTLAGGNIQIHK
jgi:hypothetical protein